MVLAVVDDDAHVLQREAGNGAGDEHLLDALLHGRHELVRDHAALDRDRRTRSPRRAASGSTRRETSPNWPAPPVCFLWRWKPSACAVIVSRYGMRGGRVVDLELELARHPLEHRAQVQVAQRAQHRLVGRRVVLDDERRILGQHPVQHVGNPLLVAPLLRLIATPCIGTGNSSGRMWMWSSSCESCSTQSNSISSTFATAAMSPGTARSISTFLPPCSRNRWPTLNGLRPSPMKSCVSLRHRALVHAEDPELADERVDDDLEHVREHVLLRIGLRVKFDGRLALALVEQRRIALGGIGQQLDEHLEQFGDARRRCAPTRSTPARDGLRAAPSRTARAAARARPRPARGRATSAPRRPRPPGRRARGARPRPTRNPASPAGLKKQSTTRLPPSGGQVDRQAFLAERRLDGRQQPSAGRRSRRRSC